MRNLKEFDEHPIAFEEVMKKGLFRAICKYVVDGDTVDLMVDLGWYNFVYVTLRMKDIDTPELRGTTGLELKHAKEAKLRVEQILLEQPVLLKTSKGKVSFGRFVGDIWFSIPDQSGYNETIKFDIEDNTFTYAKISELLRDEGFEKKSSY